MQSKVYFSAQIPLLFSLLTNPPQYLLGPPYVKSSIWCFPLEVFYNVLSLVPYLK